MTLLELLLGLVVVAMVVTAGYATFASVIDRRADMQGTLDATLRAATLRHTLVNWLRFGVISVGTGAVPQQGGGLGMAGEDNQLQVATTEPNPLRTSPVGILLSVNTTDPYVPRGLTALLRAAAGADSVRLQLDPNVTGMRIEYLTDTTNGRRWMTNEAYREAGGAIDGRQKAPPIAIRLTLLAANPAMLPPLLRLPIVLPLRRL